MAFRVDVDVQDWVLDDDFYGFDALVILERSDSELGTYTPVGQHTIKEGETRVSIDDDGGTFASWYHTLYASLDLTKYSDPSAPFRGGALRAYVDTDTLERMLPKVQAGKRDLGMLDEWCRNASAVIDSRIARPFDFYRHPQVDGTEVRYFDIPTYGSRRIVVPQGIVSVTSVEWAPYTGGTFTPYNVGDWILSPATPNPGDTRWYIDLVQGSRYPIDFYPGMQTVRVTGAFGFAAVPDVIRAGTLAVARDMAAAVLTPGGSARGDWGNPNALLPTDGYVAVEWARNIGPGGDWFA